jgi:RimJ/RimL family protein N-acetyltransferase
MQLLTSRLKLREFIESDYPALREMDLRSDMHTFERELPDESDTRKSLDEYIREQLDPQRKHFRLAITIPPCDQVRGIAKISSQWEAIREWEVGWAVHSEEWGKGYATEAAWQLIDWAFKELNVHRVVAFCHADNTRSVRVMEKLGMHRDGRLRETRWLGNRWWDEYIYSILDR